MTEIEIGIWATRFHDLAKTLAGDSAHDPAHSRRVAETAVRFAMAEKAQLEIVLPAAWLHDCVAVPKDLPDRSRASSLSAIRALDFLRDAGYPEVFFDSIGHCIEAHSFSAGIAPQTLEAKIVQDADRIDALGAIGIARCFSVGGAMHRAIYSEDDPFCQGRSPDDSAFSVDHFFEKLFRMAETMQTGAGRLEARLRIGFMRSFLDHLALEIGTLPDP